MTHALLTRRAPGAASTFDPDAMTVEVILSSGAPVERMDPRGPFVEILDLGGARWPERIPLLDSHSRGSVDDVLGYVTGIRREGDRIVGMAHLSRNSPKAQRIAADLGDGMSFGISVGYHVGRWTERTTGDRRERVAANWTLVEASFVSIAADQTARTRSQTMEEDVIEQTAPETRAAVNAEIRSIAEVAGLSRAWADAQIDAGATAEAARDAAFEAMRTRSRPVAEIRTTDHNRQSLDNPEAFIRAAGEAVFARVAPNHQVSEPARQFVGMNFRDLAIETLKRSGMSTTGLSAATVITRALHSTSDFALILGDTVGRGVRAAYAAAPSGLKTVARMMTLLDFRERKQLQMSQFSTLEKVNEHGEFKRGTIEESGEAIRLGTFGRVFGVTRQAIVNDDLGAFADVPRKLGIAAAQFEANQLAALLVSGSGLGPVMSDSKRLFHADHGNLAASGGAIGETPVSAARLAMRSQKDASGQLISVTPKYLVVGAELETTAEKFLASIAPATTDDVNPFSGKLTLVVEPRVSGNDWYIVADPAEIDGLVYANLEGESGPQIETRSGFDIDGVETRIRLDFGCAFLDWRGWYRNPGA
ncbi:prohead protease/major capsid protein fusion protein [Prosthecomicrobium sp. N25]|uniref:prohead protease/major capsid protein fusion protein n=1 Tax=Prosthecomicrobium sp. N25 TaxID=3129254 RepID=UPI003077B204